jgi:hypothetical protein
MFVLDNPFQPRLMFAGKARAYLSKVLSGVLICIVLLALLQTLG